MRAHEDLVGGHIGGSGDGLDAEGTSGQRGIDGRIRRLGIDDLFVGGHDEYCNGWVFWSMGGRGWRGKISRERCLMRERGESKDQDAAEGYPGGAEEGPNNYGECERSNPGLGKLLHPTVRANGEKDLGPVDEQLRH